jgi:hypothetical protein
MLPTQTKAARTQGDYLPDAQLAYYWWTLFFQLIVIALTLVAGLAPVSFGIRFKGAIIAYLVGVTAILMSASYDANRELDRITTISDQHPYGRASSYILDL